MSAGKEKAVDLALRRLTPEFMKRLDAEDVRHSLYGKEQLTWTEYEQIGATGTASKKTADLLAALRRRGPDILDIMLEVLRENEVANGTLIQKIMEVYDVTKLEAAASSQSMAKRPSLSSEQEKEFLGNGEWPYPAIVESVPSEPPTPPPPPPQEGIDSSPKMAYKMTSRPRGIGLVINNKNFTCGMKERIGTDKDAESLTRLLIYLGLYTNRYDNLKGREMHKRLQDVSELDHSRFDCLVICVLTHGISGKLYSTDGDLIPVDDVTRYFDGNNCPSLIGKPKIFIIQACRGGRFDYGVELETTDAPDPPALTNEQLREAMEEQYDKVVEKALDDQDETDGGGYNGALPTEADFVLAYATVPGYVSWRNSEYGSWFIKALVDTMFELSKKEHFMDILIEVNRRVAEEFQSKGRNKQIPSPVTMLTRKLYFRPGSYS